MKVKFNVFIPVRFNDGAPIPRKICVDMETSFIEHFGGFTIEGTKKGAYRMKSGKRQDDVSIDYCVIIEHDQEDFLRAYVRELARLCKQECLLFMKSPCEIEFVEPATDGVGT